MKRVAFLKVVNLLAFLTGCVALGTGLILGFRLTHGSGSATVLGLTRHDWGEVHFWVTLVLTAIVVVHILLHRTWLLHCAANHRYWRLGATFALGAVIVFAPVLAPKGTDGKHAQKQEHAKHH